jgi:hypothetical protein
VIRKLQRSFYLIARTKAILLSIYFVCLPTATAIAEPDSAAIKAVETSRQFCRATEEYLNQAEIVRSTHTPDLDFSCLTDVPSISATLPSYQLIDIRLNSESDTPLPGAWQMPVIELKTKLFLKTRQLLLIGEGFGRAPAAAHCAILKKAGFENVKILVSGPPSHTGHSAIV